MKTIQDIMDELQVGKSWVEQRIKEGKIKIIWFGGIRRISNEEFERIKNEGVK